VSAKEEILGRVRMAVGEASPAEVPRDYRGSGTVADPVELFCARVSDYRATVHRDLDALHELCRGRVVRAPGVEWDAPADSPDLSPTDLDSIDTALTGCALAIAETGTIVLDGGSLSGRRALTLVPDHHICLVRADQVVGSVPEAIERLAETARAGRPITFVSGPSATSDIELERVEGVHGPRRLDVIVVD
jgi:L-lactate dehydrogenase complex protein LldG